MTAVKLTCANHHQRAVPSVPLQMTLIAWLHQHTVLKLCANAVQADSILFSLRPYSRAEGKVKEIQRHRGSQEEDQGSARGLTCQQESKVQSLTPPGQRGERGQYGPSQG